MSVSSSTMSVGVMAIFSGLLGAYGLRAMLLGEQTPPPPPLPTITVPLAAADLPQGRKITLSDIALHSMTRKKMDERGYNTSEVMLGTEFLVGRTLQQPVVKGEPFLTSSLFLEGTGEDIAKSLRPGERAVAIEVSKRRGGNLAPGTAVDVLFRSEAQPASETQLAIPETTIVLFENVRVVYVEKPSSAPVRNLSQTIDLRMTNGRFLNIPKPLPIVTLAVNLDQANVLHTVEGRGELTLVPRATEAANEGGPNAIASTGQSQPRSQMTLEQLLEIKEVKPFRTEIYRGGTRHAHQFDGNGSIELAP